MIVALLAALGIPLWLVIAIAVHLVRQRRWVRSRPGTFGCAMRRTAGEAQDTSEKWRRGYALWVREVLAFRSGQSLSRESLFAVDGVGARGVRRASPGEVKRLGPEPAVIALRIAGGGAVEVAAHAEDRGLAVGPFAEAAAGDRGADEREPAPAA